MAKLHFVATFTHYWPIFKKSPRALSWEEDNWVSQSGPGSHKLPRTTVSTWLDPGNLIDSLVQLFPPGHPPSGRTWPLAHYLWISLKFLKCAPTNSKYFRSCIQIKSDNELIECNRVFLKAKYNTGAFGTQNPWESGGGGSGQNGGKENETVCVFVKGSFPPKPSPTLTSDKVLNLAPDVRTSL